MNIETCHLYEQSPKDDTIYQLLTHCAIFLIMPSGIIIMIINSIMPSGIIIMIIINSIMPSGIIIMIIINSLFIEGYTVN